jgi:hypothetical protein
MQSSFSLRPYSTTSQTPVATSYERTAFPHIKGQEGGWRDTPEQHARIGRTAEAISTLAGMSFLPSLFLSNPIVFPSQSILFLI